MLLGQLFDLEGSTMSHHLNKRRSKPNCTHQIILPVYTLIKSWGSVSAQVSIMGNIRQHTYRVIYHNLAFALDECK